MRMFERNESTFSGMYVCHLCDFEVLSLVSFRFVLHLLMKFELSIYQLQIPGPCSLISDAHNRR